MRIYDISIFAGKSFTPQFDTLSNFEDVLLRIYSGNSSSAPKLTIFFANQQEATNFKNAVIQSWETFLRDTKEKSNG